MTPSHRRNRSSRSQRIHDSYVVIALTIGQVSQPGWKDNFSVPLGITGAQEFIPLVLDAVNRGRLSLEDVARLCALAPARRFGLHPRKGAIEVGADADFTIVDMAKENEFRKEDMATRAGHTSWEGMRTRGMPVCTIVRGSIVMQNGEIVARPGSGRFHPGKGVR
ncbi:MAG: amidohydrolase family protein [Burkholderiaceae bacterium]|nr:amidohydrolase family protein [Burkholderiaceae bacterium]